MKNFFKALHSKGIIPFFSIIILIIIIGMGVHSWYMHHPKPDDKKRIVGLAKPCIKVGPVKTEPDASYRSPIKVCTNDHTRIEGTVENFAQLKKNQIVKLWYTERSKGQHKGQLMAKKISVSK